MDDFTDLDLENNVSELTKEEKKVIKNEVKELLKEKEKNITDTKTIKENLTKEEKIVNFFDSIEFLSLDSTHKEEVAKKIKLDSSGDRLYWIEIFLSSIIAVLGLLQNSVAVVIGAMLIAPYLRPINGLGFAIATGAGSFFVKAFKVLIYSILFSIFLGFIITHIIGIEIETKEILARVNPNLIDFLIAIFSAMIAVMSIRFTRLGESIAGVAMAASLLPPLGVVGIELSLGNYMSSFGALMLFGANLIAILFVSVIFFWLYGFTPHDTKIQSKVLKRIGIVTFILVIILIPLFLSLDTLKTSTFLSNKTKNYLENIIKEDLQFYEISEINVIKNTKDTLEIKVVLKIPEGYNITKILDNIYSNLQNEFDKKVNIDLEIIRTIRISS
ncbi:MAG: TIGR00341 family protein [Candidatus Gracilibacteria bacterium]|nr:TIGR00341 family protein [Candidatus Gracilibacteria bacterium]